MMTARPGRAITIHYSLFTIDYSQRLLHPPHALRDDGQVGAEGDAQVALALRAEGRAGDCDDTAFEQALGHAHGVAVAAHVNHRVESAVGPDCAQVKFGREEVEQVVAPLAENLPVSSARFRGLLSPGGERGLL